MTIVNNYQVKYLSIREKEQYYVILILNVVIRLQIASVINTLLTPKSCFIFQQRIFYRTIDWVLSIIASYNSWTK